MSNLSRVVEATRAELAAKRQREALFNDPGAWCKYMLGFDLWSAQEKIGAALVDNKSVVVKAAHGTGKTYSAAVFVCWWIDTRYPRVFVASTAPSQAQISALLWRYVRQLKSLVRDRYKQGLVDHDLPGYITSDNQWKEDGGNILGFGRKPPDNKEDDSFQGIHDAYVLAVGDESVGLSEAMIDALGNITSNAGSRRLLLCNPTNPHSYVGHIFGEGLENWTKLTISAFDSPNFTGGEGLPPETLEKLVDQSYVDEKKLEYGENSARYKSRVLGEFAFDMENTLFNPEDIETGKSTEVEPTGASRPRLGVDVARMGKDTSAIYLYHEGQVRLVEEFSKTPTTETANRVHRHALDLGVDEVRVDSDGVGAGVKDQLVQLADGLYRVLELHGNARSPDRRQWLNGRAWWWDNVRKRLSEGEIDIDTADEKLHDELLSVQYLFAPTGGLQIESKESMAKRGVKSPNRADAMIYAAADLGVDFDDPLSQLSPGDRIMMNAADILVDVPAFYRLMGGML